MEDTFEEVVRDSWESRVGIVYDKLERLKTDLKLWANSIKERREGLKKKLTKQLEILMEQDRSDEVMAKIIDTKIHLNMEIEKDELYWEQRARANWLKAGDRNTAFFHRFATMRRKINTISKLDLEDGGEANEASEINEVATRYFQNLFTSSEVGDPSHLLTGIDSKIPVEINRALMKKYTAEEVHEALKGMGPTKAPGRDGFPAIFFQKFWHIVAQSAFVPGRLITDNVLLAYEILHTFRQKRRGKKGYMAVKLDMSKAYDRVEWGYLKEVMLCMGFDIEWVDLVMKCISTTSYVVNTNGGYGRSFKPTRGLRQGDPLNPFLFLMCSEGLSALMRLASKERLLKAAKASRRGPKITHLLFADDCILFGEATARGATVLKEILKEYGKSSGQCVNFNKSTIFFSTNTTEDKKNEVSAIMGIRTSTNMERYLGLSNVVGRRKKESFQYLKEKIYSRIEGWSTRIDIEGIFAKFWWQKAHGRRGIHWCKWTYLCRSKGEGGLGFRDMAKFNVSLLAKRGWRILNYLDSLLAQVLKAKCFPNNNFLDSCLGNNASYTWKSIWATKGILREGMCWRVGRGEQITVGCDNWIPDVGRNRLSAIVANLNDCKVADLINQNNRTWKEELIISTFPEDVAEKIIGIPLAEDPHDDFRVWSAEASGEFTVRSSYKLLQNIEDDPRAYALQEVWKELPCNVLVHERQLEFAEWLTGVFAKNSESQCRIFCCALWAIWGDRNNRVHNKVNKSGKEIGRFVSSYITELDGIGKTYDGKSKQSTAGIVARNNEGKVLLSCSMIYQQVASPFAAEALASQKAIKIGKEMKWRKIIIEGDSLSIIKKCRSNIPDKSQVCAYISDILKLQSRFQECRFEHVPRAVNSLTHTIAKATLRDKRIIYLVEGVPEYVEDRRERDGVGEQE
ncbi:uncharacterized protein LOC105793109 [Gossypium raimondii]|uniref:uncharacterized protein LOC105793109 n=1 Tax=Gossypium raimondii TaxID=29730 RepID=UPI00063B0465|nr:uncharacterized protein LOC105793109 [Gossypium raimondii]